MMPLCTTETCAVHVRMRVALDRRAVRRPARVADAGVALQRLLQQARLEVAQLALGAAALEVAVLDGGDAGRVIAAILEPTQRVDEVGRDRLLPENADDAAHASRSLSLRRYNTASVCLICRSNHSMFLRLRGLKRRVAGLIPNQPLPCASPSSRGTSPPSPDAPPGAERSSARASRRTSLVMTLPEPM